SRFPYFFSYLASIWFCGPPLERFLSTTVGTIDDAYSDTDTADAIGVAFQSADGNYFWAVLQPVDAREQRL
ncbi:hypothetical protein NQ312_27915, partial [Escherichia coli]|nr:hypothetical protein [Escherichia coli]